MSQFALVTNGTAVELQGGRPIFATAGEGVWAQHPWAITYLWSAQELAAVGVYPITEQAIPAGKISTGTALVFANGVVTREHTLADKPALTKAELVAHAAEARWTKEIGGITIQGIPVDTTRDSQAMINGAFSLVSAEPSSIIKFKATGGFVELDAAAMTAIAIAVGQHVQTAFATEATVLAGIEAGTITTTAQIDAAFA